MLLQLEFKSRNNPEIQLRTLWTQHARGWAGESRPGRAGARWIRIPMYPRLDDPAGDGEGPAVQVDPVEVRGTGEERPVAGGPALPGLGLAAAAAGASAGRSSPAWSATPRTRPTRISRSCTGMPPSRWPPVDARRAARLASSSRIPRIQEFMARRIGSLGTPESLAILVEELGRAAARPRRATLLIGIEEGLRGRRQVAMPAEWPRVFATLAADADARVRSRAVALALTFGDPSARATLRGVLSDAGARLDLRREALAALLKVKDPSLPATLHEPWSRDPALGGPGGARAVGLRRSRRRPRSCSRPIDRSGHPSVATS